MHILEVDNPDYQFCQNALTATKNVDRKAFNFKVT
jgi:hypothetical protein